MTVARIAATALALSVVAASSAAAQSQTQASPPAHGPLAADAAAWNRAVSRDAAWFATPEARRMATAY